MPLIPSHDIVLSTYPLLTRDHDILVAQQWHIVILDEAQSIKNPQAEATRQVLRLKAKQSHNLEHKSPKLKRSFSKDLPVAPSDEKRVKRLLGRA